MTRMVPPVRDRPLLTNRFQRAFTMASEVHAAQVRKGTHIPYLAHLMSVAALVLEYGGGEDAAIGGLLHDAVEDSDDGEWMKERIRGSFGNRVANIVMGCSDAVAVPGQPKPPWRGRKQKYLDRLKQEKDEDVLLVSACDKLHNARTIVADLGVIGPALWDRFSENDPEAQLWYYGSLAAVYRDRLVVKPLCDELDRTIGEMRSRAAAPDMRGYRSTRRPNMSEAGTMTTGDSIVIAVTQGGLDNHYLSLTGHTDFFPADAVGAANAKDGEGVPLILHFAGLPDSSQTDISGIHSSFRRRGPWRRFFAHHGLVAGDQVGIERLAAYEYRIIPLPKSPTY